VLRIIRRPVPLVAPADHRRYGALLTHAFRANAPLTRSLRAQVTPRELRRLAALLGFDVRARPRDLDARQWAGVFAHVTGSPR